MKRCLYKLATDKYRGWIFVPIKLFLFILSFIYGWIVNILILFYRKRAYQLNCKVISVGNITLGGTGKTSLVEYIAQYLKERGKKIAILSRGYKRRISDYRLPITNYRAMGDEPYMLLKKLENIPVIVDANRIRAAKKVIRDYVVDTVILDDGFQQWKIKKDLEIVTVDATCPFGNRYLLPRGILREPLSSLKRADLFILTKTNLNSNTQNIKYLLRSINPEADIFESIHKPVGFYKMDKTDELLKIDILKAKTVTLFSGIADPESFENLIKSLSINIGLSFRFPDHYGYVAQDLENIIKESQEKNIDTLITTEKDVVRLNTLTLNPYPLPLFILCIKLEIIRDEQGFHNRLLKLYYP